jgi:hypothetical protein
VVTIWQISESAISVSLRPGGRGERANIAVPGGRAGGLEVSLFGAGIVPCAPV